MPPDAAVSILTADILTVEGRLVRGSADSRPCTATAAPCGRYCLGRGLRGVATDTPIRCRGRFPLEEKL